MAFKARSKAEADAIVMHQRSAATGQQVAGIKTDVANVKSDIGNIKNTLDMILGATVCFYVIKDVDGTPINGAQVTFHLSGSDGILVSTDASGAAFVRGIPPTQTPYAYTVEAVGYTDITNKAITVNGDCLEIVEMVGT